MKEKTRIKEVEKETTRQNKRKNVKKIYCDNEKRKKKEMKIRKKIVLLSRSKL